MNQRTFLGLTHNPFTAPREGFFVGGDRKTHLDHLRHLSQWSRRILVVSGPFGMGKSTLFRELSGSLEPGVKAARLSGAVVASEREALVGLSQGFGVAADLDMHTADLIEVVKRYVVEQDELGRVCMTMVDDAHLLNQGAIDCLVNIVEGSPLKLLLFAEATLISDLSRVAKLRELEWFEIRLTGFPKADVISYLEWRFRQAHYRGRLPFTDEQLDKIVQRSRGNPSVVDGMANRLLADLESGDIRGDGRKFPLTHLILALSLVVLVSLIYIFVQDPSATTVDKNVVVHTAEVPSVEEGTPIGEPPLLSSAKIEQVEQLIPNEDHLPEAIPVQADAIEVQQLSTTDGEQGATDPAELFIEEDSTAETVLLDAASRETAVGSDKQIKVLQTPTEVIPVVESVADTALSPPTEEPSVSTTTLQSTLRYKTAQWILKQNSDRFTMQLLTLSSKKRAENFIQRQANPEEFGLYRMRREGRQLYVIIYGVFSGRRGAQTALAEFTGELGRIKPWIRSMALVQDTIRNNEQ